jgi:hypothetical protein
MKPKAPWTTMPMYRRREKKKPNRQGLRPISERRRAVNQIYLKMRKEFLRINQLCEVYDSCATEVYDSRATDVHHTRGRAGTLLIDQRFWMAVSRKGHRWIDNNKEISRQVGWLCEKGLWNVAPKDAETARLRRLIAEAKKP